MRADLSIFLYVVFLFTLIAFARWNASASSILVSTIFYKTRSYIICFASMQEIEIIFQTVQNNFKKVYIFVKKNLPFAMNVCKVLLIANMLDMCFIPSCPILFSDISYIKKRKLGSINHCLNIHDSFWSWHMVSDYICFGITPSFSALCWKVSHDMVCYNMKIINISTIWVYYTGYFNIIIYSPNEWLMSSLLELYIDVWCHVSQLHCQLRLIS